MPYADPERQAEYFRNYFKAHQAEKNAYHRERRVTNPIVREREKRYEDGRNRFQRALTSAKKNAKKRGHMPCTSSAEEIEVAFTGLCHICSKPELECRTNLHMDHDHANGPFRGWLCNECNFILGLVKDSVDQLERLSTYLVKARPQVGADNSNPSMLRYSYLAFDVDLTHSIQYYDWPLVNLSYTQPEVPSLGSTETLGR